MPLTTDGSTIHSTAAALPMQTAPPLTGLVLTLEAIHWPAEKKARSSRLPGKKAI
jgi:hypothetical protein